MTYKETHKALVDLLSVNGIVSPYNARLDLFWLWRHIPKLGMEPQTAAAAERLITILVHMRSQGEEPKHSGGKYSE